MTALCSPQICCSFVTLHSGNKGLQNRPAPPKKKRAGKVCWIINSSATYCPIALKFGMLMQYESPNQTGLGSNGMVSLWFNNFQLYAPSMILDLIGEPIMHFSMSDFISYRMRNFANWTTFLAFCWCNTAREQKEAYFISTSCLIFTAKFEFSRVTSYSPTNFGDECFKRNKRIL